MEHLVAIMLLVGCNADATTCAEVPVPSPSYSTVSDCEADLGFQMRLSHTFDRQILGACTAVDEALLEQSATIDWAVSRGGALMVEITAEEPQSVASLDRSAGEDWSQVASR